ncbi:alpha/beta fold hydrolase [Amycolatopsis sp. cmx-11-32]
MAATGVAPAAPSARPSKPVERLGVLVTNPGGPARPGASGAVIDQVGNLNAARDLDVVRAALGEEKPSYAGYSYATLLGQQYAERSLRRIRAMVNDGNRDHSLRTTYRFMRSLTVPVERDFPAFAKLCVYGEPL